MKKLLLSTILATALFSAPAMAKVEPNIIRTTYGDFDAHGQLLSANETALKAMNFKTVQKKANQGDNIAQYHLAKMYELGIHTPKDEPKAQEWYKKSAENGNPLAMNNYAYYLMQDEQNNEVALSFLKKASELNLPHAKMNLAVRDIFDNKEVEKGEKMLFELANNGFAPAYYTLYEYFGEAIIQDKNSDDTTKEQVYFDRHTFLEKSAEMGFSIAQMKLSDYYQTNYVMSPNKIARPTGIINAYKWANRACVNGIKRGCQTAEHFATIKNADFGDEKKQCEMGNQDACENYKISKYIQEEMNKLDK